MSAFDKQPKKKKMPKDVWVLKDLQETKYMSVYASDPANATWVSQPLAAIHYDTQQEVNDIIEDDWGLVVGARYIGSNPNHPPH